MGPYINLAYTTKDGDGKFTGTPLFFYKPMTLTAYYPFTGAEGTAPGTNGVIKAITSAENQVSDKQPGIDFLWDCKTGVNKQDFSVSNPNVNFTFAHKMSKLSFTFLSSKEFWENGVLVSKGVDVSTMISYEIAGLGIEGTFDITKGVCAIDETKGRQGLKITFPKDTPEMEKREFPSLIVFPQQKPSGGDFILHITTDELNEDETAHQKYKCALRFTDNVIKAGCHYKFTIQVTKYGLIVGDLSIEPWVSAPEKFITATIDGNPVFRE